MTIDQIGLQEYRLKIEAVLTEPVGSGSFTETHCVDGQEFVYQFTQATGLRWLFFKQAYQNRFRTLPDWVLSRHPLHRANLCRLALDEGTPLPDLLAAPN